MANREDLIRQLRTRFNDVGTDFNERQRRHWAAAEALKLGRGGISIVSEALRISPNTIRKGVAEITTMDGAADSAEEMRIRRVGGGRKPRKTAENSLQ